MMYLCKCGAIKHGQPYKSAVTKDWICERCAQRSNKRKATPSQRVVRIRTLQLLKKQSIR